MYTCLVLHFPTKKTPEKLNDVRRKRKISELNNYYSTCRFPLSISQQPEGNQESELCGSRKVDI